MQQSNILKITLINDRHRPNNGGWDIGITKNNSMPRMKYTMLINDRISNQEQRELVIDITNLQF